MEREPINYEPWETYQLIEIHGPYLHPHLNKHTPKKIGEIWKLAGFDNIKELLFMKISSKFIKPHYKWDLLQSYQGAWEWAEIKMK